MTRSPADRILLGMIGFYRSAISPLLPPACRYEPTCSEYARIAIECHGAGRGSWLALRRLGRCHPFGGSGWDPVPGAGSSTPSTRDQDDGNDN